MLTASPAFVVKKSLAPSSDSAANSAAEASNGRLRFRPKGVGAIFRLPALPPARRAAGKTFAELRSQPRTTSGEKVASTLAVIQHKLVRLTSCETVGLGVVNVILKSPFAAKVPTHLFEELEAVVQLLL
jgi:hypothetical protein